MGFSGGPRGDVVAPVACDKLGAGGGLAGAAAAFQASALHCPASHLATCRRQRSPTGNFWGRTAPRH